MRRLVEMDGNDSAVQERHLQWQSREIGHDRVHDGHWRRHQCNHRLTTCIERGLAVLERQRRFAFQHPLPNVIVLGGDFLAQGLDVCQVLQLEEAHVVVLGRPAEYGADPLAKDVHLVRKDRESRLGAEDPAHIQEVRRVRRPGFFHAKRVPERPPSSQQVHRQADSRSGTPRLAPRHLCSEQL